MRPLNTMDPTANKRIAGAMNCKRYESAAGERAISGGMQTTTAGIMTMIGMTTITITDDRSSRSLGVKRLQASSALIMTEIRVLLNALDDSYNSSCVPWAWSPPT